MIERIDKLSKDIKCLNRRLNCISSTSCNSYTINDENFSSPSDACSLILSESTQQRVLTLPINPESKTITIINNDEFLFNSVNIPLIDVSTGTTVTDLSKGSYNIEYISGQWYITSKLVVEIPRSIIVTKNFITNSGISSSDGLLVLNFIKEITNAGIYEKFTAIYPFIGATLASHRLNLIDPYNTDSALRMNFFNTVNHTSSGVEFTSGSYGDTNIDPGAISYKPTIGVSLYMQNIVPGGYVSNGTSAFAIWPRDLDGRFYAYISSNAPSGVIVPARKEFLIAQRSTINDVELWGSSSLIANSTGLSGSLLLGSNSIKINYNYNTPQTNLNTLSFFAVHEKLTSSEISSYYAAINTFMQNRGITTTP